MKPQTKKQIEKENIRKEIIKELEQGINRNGVLPLDWAMDRINPLLDKLYDEGHSSALNKMRIELDKRISHLASVGSFDEERRILNNVKVMLEELE